MLRCNSHVLRHLSCFLERLGALATIPAPADKRSWLSDVNACS
jgi:hypothetical protein